MLGPLLLAAGLASSAHASPEASALPATMRWEVRESTILERVAPAYPAGVTGDPGDVACRATVRVDAGGVPADVAVEGCPAPFAAATERALEGWRWAPWTATAERRVTLTIRFPRPVRSGPAQAAHSGGVVQS